MAVQSTLKARNPSELYSNLIEPFFVNSICINSGEYPITKKGEHYKFLFIPDDNEKKSVQLCALEFDVLLGISEEEQRFAFFNPKEFPAKSAGFYHYHYLKTKLIPNNMVKEKSFINEKEETFSYTLSEFAKKGEYLAEFVSEFSKKSIKKSI